MYIDSGTKVDLICVNGHAWSPTPINAVHGRCACGQCAVEFDRVYLISHAEVSAIKVGVASGESRVRDHRRRGYRLLAERRDLTHQQAAQVERELHRFWRAFGHDAIAAAPQDGRTETAPDHRLMETAAFLNDVLGPPVELDRNAISLIDPRVWAPKLLIGD